MKINFGNIEINCGSGSVTKLSGGDMTVHFNSAGGMEVAISGQPQQAASYTLSQTGKLIGQIKAEKKI